MIIKKYVAVDLDQAMQAMLNELGPEAVVLAQRPVQTSGLFGWFGSKKVEVTAAIEPEQLKAFRTQKALPGGGVSRPKSVLQSNLEELKQSLPANSSGAYGDPRLKKTAQVAMAPAPQQPKADREPEAMNRAAQGLIERFREAGGEVEKTAPAPVRKPKPMAKPTPEPTANTEEQLRRVIREEMSRAQHVTSVGSMENNDEDVVGSVRFLMSKGVGRSIALEIEALLTQKLGKVDLTKRSPKRSEWLNAMHRELSRRVKTAGPIELARGRTTTVALVGSTGVGKTTTLAKLAATYANELGRKVAVISLDTVKLGAREQISILTEKMGIPLQVVTTATQLTQALDQFKGNDLVLIDTAGCNQYHRDEIQELADLLSVVPGLRVMLAVCAGTKDVDVIGTIKNFSPLSIDSLIVTKLDETIAHGVMVNICEKTGLPISYVTDGQRMSGHMRVADATMVSKGILLEHNSAEERSLRELVGA